MHLNKFIFSFLFVIQTFFPDKKFDAVLIDVDSKDSSKGLSCPPEVFLEPEFINNVSKCLYSQG